MTDMNRFLSKVVPEPNSGCWLWIGTGVNNGYGQFYDRTSNRMVLATRWIYREVHGETPLDEDICHKCDVRCCVNPDHLFSGTRKDNMQDALSKGRLPNATRSYCSRGHKYSAETTKRYRGPNQRICLLCQRLHKNKRDQQKRESKRAALALIAKAKEAGRG